MKTVAIIIIFCAVVSFFELRSLRRSGLKRERLAFMLLMAAAAAFSIALALHVPIPSPLHIIFGLFGPIADWADALQEALEPKPISIR
jgi:ABC-type Co2+ transport system permease subunit